MACLPPGAGAEVFRRLISVLTGLASPVSEICMSWAFLPSFIFPGSLLLSCKVTQRPIVAVPAMFSLCVWAPLHCHYAAKKGKGLHVYIPSLGNQTFPPPLPRTNPCWPARCSPARAISPLGQISRHRLYTVRNIKSSASSVSIHFKLRFKSTKPALLLSFICFIVKILFSSGPLLILLDTVYESSLVYDSLIYRIFFYFLLCEIVIILTHCLLPGAVVRSKRNYMWNSSLGNWFITGAQ